MRSEDRMTDIAKDIASLPTPPKINYPECCVEYAGLKYWPEHERVAWSNYYRDRGDVYKQRLAYAVGLLERTYEQVKDVEIPYGPVDEIRAFLAHLKGNVE